MESKENKKVKYILIGHIEIRFGDPISSINMNSNFCIIGTMFGKLILYNLNKREALMLIESSEEEILNINFSSNNSINSNDFYCCVGDKYILKYSIKPNILNKNYPIISLTSTINNYSDEFLHVKDCDNAIVYCVKEILFIISIDQIKKKPMVLNTTDSSYIIKNIETMDIIERGYIKTTNYVVPFDFDGKYFILLQFFTINERMLFSINVFTLKTWKYLLRKEFGILNYCKFINDNKLFIVRNYNKCEIRIMDDNFTVVNSFQHIGDNVIGVDFFYKITKNIVNTNIKRSSNMLDLNKKKDINSETETKKFGYNTNNNNLNSEDNLNTSFNDNKIIIHKSENIIANASINIILLDIDGNINCYNEKGIRILFNINKIPEIDESIRQKGLFSLNYPYMIKYYHPYLAISTDNGCYIFQLNI